MQICKRIEVLYTTILSQKPGSLSPNILLINGPLDILAKGPIAIFAMESLPVAETHINRLFAACILIGNNSLASDSLVCHGDDLAAELVVLCLTVLVKHV